MAWRVWRAPRLASPVSLVSLVALRMWLAVVSLVWLVLARRVQLVLGTGR